MSKADGPKLDVFNWISADFLGTEAREIAEAVLGLKVSRLYLRQDALDALDNSARRFGFGLSVGGFKHVLRQNREKWSDTITGLVPLSSAEGLFVAYVARNLKQADLARRYDEDEAHEEFGVLLGIPHCCITRFCDQWRRSSDTFDSMTYLVNRRNCNLVNAVDWRNNVLGQFFQRGLVSYMPCKFECQNTRRVVSTVFERLSRVAPKIASHCFEGHKRPYLSDPTGQIVEMARVVGADGVAYHLAGFDGESAWEVIWKVAPRDPEANMITENIDVFKDSSLVLEPEIADVQIIVPAAGHND